MFDDGGARILKFRLVQAKMPQKCLKNALVEFCHTVDFLANLFFIE